jgi:RNA polymerase sigma-70 factor (ECF subfamily)
VSTGPVGRARKAVRLGELTQGVGRGDKDCFAQLYDLTVPSVYGVAQQLLQSTRLATAVTEEVYVEVWRSAPRYDPSESSVLAWMMGMAHRQCTAKAEAMADRPDAAANGNERNVARPVREAPPGPDAERAGQALSALSDPNRQAVVLAYFGKCSQGEVARILGLPVGTVTTRIRNGLVGLRTSREVGT